MSTKSPSVSLRKKSIVDTAATHVRLKFQGLGKKKKVETVDCSPLLSPRKLFYEGLDANEITGLEKDRFYKTGCFSPSSIIETFDKENSLPKNYFEYGGQQGGSPLKE
jgi:hypothetical protein